MLCDGNRRPADLGDEEYSGYNDNIYYTIPVGAVEIGYRIKLPAVGSDFTATNRFYVNGSGTTHFNKEVTFQRPAS